MTTSEIARTIRAHLEAGVVKKIDFYRLTDAQIEILMGAGYQTEENGEFTTVIIGE